MSYNVSLFLATFPCLVKKLLLGDHESRLGVSDEDEDVGVEAKLVDPLVQV
jgi:hypothetical protein